MLAARGALLTSPRNTGRPWLYLSERSSYESADERLANFIRENNIMVLNVAGTRGSKENDVTAFVKRTLEHAFYPRPEAMMLRG